MGIFCKINLLAKLCQEIIWLYMEKGHVLRKIEFNWLEKGVCKCGETDG